MHKTTFDLYRCSALLWAGLEYEDALAFKKEKALEAKKYYQMKASKMSMIEFPDTHNKYKKLYDASDDAAKWNQHFIDEIKKEKRKDEYTNYQRKKRTLLDKWYEGVSLHSKNSNDGIFIGAWKWLKNNFSKIKKENKWDVTVDE